MYFMIESFILFGYYFITVYLKGTQLILILRLF